MNFQEDAQEKRRQMRGIFSRRELKNPITAKSVIERYQVIYDLEHWPFGRPKNMLSREIINKLAHGKTH